MRQGNLQTATTNLQFYESTKISRQAYLSEFVHFINRKEIFNQHACSRKKLQRKRGGQDIFDISFS